MTLLQTDLTYPATAAACALVGSVFDVKSRRIPNFITIPSFLLGLAMPLALGGWKQLLPSLAAGILCGLVFLVFYLAGGMGAGDVQLIMAVGCIVPGSRTPSADNHECWRTRYTPLPRRVATTPRLESGKCRDAPTAVCTRDRRRKSHNSLLSVSIRVQRAQSSTHHGFHHRPRNLRRIYLLAKPEVLDQTRGASSAKESVCCGSGESRSRSSDQG